MFLNPHLLLSLLGTATLNLMKSCENCVRSHMNHMRVLQKVHNQTWWCLGKPEEAMRGVLQHPYKVQFRNYFLIALWGWQRYGTCSVSIANTIKHMSASGDINMVKVFFICPWCYKTIRVITKIRPENILVTVVGEKAWCGQNNELQRPLKAL